MSDDNDSKSGDEKKLFVDDDWKAKAEAEKKKLSEELDGNPDADESEGDGDEEGTPFLHHVQSIVMQAMMSMGLADHPMAEGQRIFDPAQARYMIDLLLMLQEKTKGNLTDEEDTYLTRVIPELQMTFVEVAKAVREQQARQQAGTPAADEPGKSGTDPAGGGPGGIVLP